MPSIVIGFIGIAAILLLIGVRMPIGLALGLVSVVGVAAVAGWDSALGAVRTIPFEFSANWSLSAVPMFLLMGSLAYHSGLTEAIFKAARLWFGFLPGGLALATNFACAGFAAASGSSLATATAMGRIAIPEMLKLKYHPGLSAGVVASAGTLGSLIPPSIIMVLYGVFAEESISQLLIAGVLPGILTASIYGAMIVIRCSINPSLAPPVKEEVSWRERFETLRPLWPLAVLIVGVIGGIYGGLVTATEAGAFGALLTFIIGVTYGDLNFKGIQKAISEAMVSTATIFFIAIGAVLLTRFLVLCGVPFFLSDLIGSWALHPLLLVLAMSIIYLVLGMFLDPIGLLLITIPVLVPMFRALDMNGIWMGILVVKFMEIGLITPPVGLNVYAIKSVVGDKIPLEVIFRGVGWFAVCDLIVVVLVVIFPQIALYLPSLMQ